MADFCEGGPRYMYRCYTPALPGVWQPQVHRSCAHNLVSGLLQRTMGPTPDPTPIGVAMYDQAAKECIRVLSGRAGSVEPWDLRRVVDVYTEKRLRVRYEQALASLLADGFCTPEDARVKAFVKGEKLSAYKVHKPRVIMGRSPRYNLELASFLRPIEHAVYGAFRGWGRRFFTHTRLIGKGLNGEERATLLRRKFRARPGIVAFEIDCKSFESHVKGLHIGWEHRVYRRLCRDPRLGELLGWQREFEGRGNGVRFKVKDIRASGDFNTGLGNTLIMCCLVLASAKSLGLGFDFLADGDNAVVFVLESDLGVWTRELPRLFLDMGHELEVGSVARSFSEICFGQCKPLWCEGVWRMVRDPLKVLSHAACGYQHYADMRGGKRVLRAVAYCEAVLGKGVPVLQAFAQSLLRATRGVSPSLGAFQDNLEYKRILARGIQWERANCGVISTASRVLFEKSWGIPPEVQVAWERSFRPNIPDGWGGSHLDEELRDGRDFWTLP